MVCAQCLEAGWEAPTPLGHPFPRCTGASPAPAHLEAILGGRRGTPCSQEKILKHTQEGALSSAGISNLSQWRWRSSRKTCICCWRRAGDGLGAAAWAPAVTDPLQMPISGRSGNVFTSEAWERMLCFGRFPSLFGWELLAGIGAELILFSMLLGILFWITPSVQASECKWIYQFLKYQLKKKIRLWYQKSHTSTLQCTATIWNLPLKTQDYFKSLFQVPKKDPHYF